MRLSTLGGAAALFSLAIFSAAAPGCGGGGGGGGGSCSMPGTLVALALEGQTAPGTGGGVYAAFPAEPISHVADGGWTAFVSDVVGGTIARGVFVARPDGQVSLVYAVGDLLPESTPGTGTITDFERVFVTAGGVVVVLVDGTVPTVGFISARVDTLGNVLEKHGMYYMGQALFARTITTPGNLNAIDPDLVAVDDQGTVFFHGTGTTGVHGIYVSDRTGVNHTAVVATGDPLEPSTLCGTTFDGMGIDADGAVCAFSVTTTGGPGKGIYVSDGGTPLRVAANGDPAPSTGGRTFQDVFAGGPLLVSLSSGITAVSWNGDLSGATPDLGVFIRVFSSTTIGPIQTIAAPGQLAQGEPLGSIYNDVFLLPSQQDPFRLTLQAQILGGDTDVIFFSSPAAGTLNEIWRNGTTVPGETSPLGNTYTSFTTPFANITDDGGSPAFSATLLDGDSGVFWAIRSCGFFTVAKVGDVAPGTAGGTFDPFGGRLVTTATNVVLFSQTVTGGTAASGLFRQG